MKKKYLKLNVDDNHLSLGNFCRVLKEYSVNKSAALQTEIFACLFDVDNIQDTTVNNYCIGCRSIGDEYKQKYLDLQKKYEKDRFVMIPIVSRVLSILEGKLFLDLSDREISDKICSSEKMREFCFKLYNISKNDKQVCEEISYKIYDYLMNDKIYEVIANILFFIVLEKKQPIYEENIKKEMIENILRNTNISSHDLEQYLNLKFCEGSNYYYSLKKLADSGNAYACFELGCLEYEGHIKDYSRYDISYSYFLKASKAGHPGGCYYIGRMFFTGNIGSLGENELKYAYEMFEQAISLGSIGALNSLGLYYLKGIYPVKKDINKALEYFNKAIEHDYVYAYNNLGSICEKEKKYEEAFSYYLKSADAGESWACNKVGECYRLGIGTKKNLRNAFSYYEKGLDSPNLYLCYYNMYNLAKYFYFSGCMDIVLTKDVDKALTYMNEASKHNIIEADIFLLYYYVDCYLKSRDGNDLERVYFYKKKIEGHSLYNSHMRKNIMDKLKEISSVKDIDISSIV